MAEVSDINGDHCHEIIHVHAEFERNQRGLE